MATSSFICDVEGSNESLRPAVSSHQLRHSVRSYTLLQVLLGVLAVLVLALTGCVMWMKLFQDCPEKYWTVRFNGTDTTFTSPRTQTYVIFGSIFTKGDGICEKKSFRLQQNLPNSTKHIMITQQNLTETFYKDAVMLREGATLSVLLNCENMIIDEDKSKLFIYQQDS